MHHSGRTSNYSVLLYVQPIPAGSLVGGALAAFEKVEVAAGASALVTLEISTEAIVMYNEHAQGRRAKTGPWKWFIPSLGLDGTFTVACYSSDCRVTFT